MIQVGLREMSLVKYLITEVLAGNNKRMQALREFMPTAKDEDWYLITAGQRVQVMKKDPQKGGVLQFGTEVITGGEGTIAGLLGASPGASTAVPAMLGVLERCFPEKFEQQWRAKFLKRVPALGTGVNHDLAATQATLAETARVLNLSATAVARAE